MKIEKYIFKTKACDSFSLAPMEGAPQNYPKRCVNSKSPKIELDGFTKPGPRQTSTYPNLGEEGEGALQEFSMENSELASSRFDLLLPPVTIAPSTFTARSGFFNWVFDKDQQIVYHWIIIWIKRVFR